MATSVFSYLHARQSAHWERGYKCHIYRSEAGPRMGLVKVTSSTGSRYAWETAGCRGACASLLVAKQCVEEAVKRRVEQLDLFENKE